MTTSTPRAYTPAQEKVLRRLAAGERIATEGLHGFWLGRDLISGMTVVILRRRGLLERSAHGYVLTAAGQAEAARLRA